jgi:hypothetical protein
VDADDVLALELHRGARLAQEQLRRLGIGERPLQEELDDEELAELTRRTGNMPLPGL